METKIVSQSVMEVMTLSRENHWHVKVVDGTGMIDSPEYWDGWVCEPTNLSDSTIPAAALGRVNQILIKNIPIKGFILAHEAPPMLPAPQVKPKPLIRWEEIPWDDIATGMVTALGYGVMAVGAVAVSALVLPLIAVGVLLDPALIVVLDDGTRVEVASWWPG